MDYNCFYDGHKCLVCEFFCKNRRSLGNHLAKTHKTSTHQYVLKYMFDDKVPLCKCGCGEEVNWHKVKYKFNDYISGHNDAGFDISKYKPTKEDIEKRNSAIKKAYKEKGEEISAKISDSVNLAWQDPVKVENNSRGKKELWKDLEYRQKMTQKRKQVWDEQGDELRKKIFTPEFGKKISLANMKRDYKNKSKKEILFIEHLKNIGLDVREDKWFNTGDMVKCYDGYFYSERLLIEYDGMYWHGLDRNSNFTFNQVKSITNDLKKNRLAKDEGWTLIRIKEGLDLSKIVDYNSLLDNAYHHQDCDGNIIKDGRFYISDYENLFSKEFLLRLHLEKGPKFVQKNILSVLIEFLKEYVSQYGWFYPEVEEDIVSAVDKIISKANFNISNKEFSSTGSIATAFLKSRFRSFWNVLGGPCKSFFDETTLERVLKYRLGLNNSKMYKYHLDGKEIQYHETFDINFKNIRRGFIVQKKTVSFFKPMVACEIYNKYLSNVDEPKVWDPSCGFGARMLGFYAFLKGTRKKGFYCGNEPANQTFDDVFLLGEDINSFDLRMNFHISKHGSENDLNVNYYNCDLVFTSPPYFDKEKYFEEDSQCWKAYPNLDLWIKYFYRPTIKNCFNCLKNGGYLILNVDKNLEEITKNCVIEEGFKFVETLKLSTGLDHFSKKHGKKEKKHEPILVFSKI